MDNECDEQVVVDTKAATRALSRTMAIQHLKSVSADLQTQIDQLEELAELYDVQVELAIVRGVLRMALDVTGFIRAGLERPTPSSRATRGR